MTQYRKRLWVFLRKSGLYLYFYYFLSKNAFFISVWYISVSSSSLTTCSGFTCRSRSSWPVLIFAANGFKMIKQISDRYFFRLLCFFLKFFLMVFPKKIWLFFLPMQKPPCLLFAFGFFSCKYFDFVVPCSHWNKITSVCIRFVAQKQVSGLLIAIACFSTIIIKPCIFGHSFVCWMCTSAERSRGAIEQYACKMLNHTINLIII